MEPQNLRVREYNLIITATAKMARFLFDSSFLIDINLHGGPFETALQIAAFSGQMESVTFLLRRGLVLHAASGAASMDAQVLLPPHRNCLVCSSKLDNVLESGIDTSL